MIAINAGREFLDTTAISYRDDGLILPQNAAWPTMHWHIDKKPTLLSVGGIMEVYTT
jgi:hypothetical protein